MFISRLRATSRLQAMHSIPLAASLGFLHGVPGRQSHLGNGETLVRDTQHGEHLEGALRPETELGFGANVIKRDESHGFHA